jgi:hypothetical protein
VHPGRGSGTIAGGDLGWAKHRLPANVPKLSQTLWETTWTSRI